MEPAWTATTDSTPASLAVVDAVADAEGVDATELSPPLYDAIDTDALDKLFAATRLNEGMSGHVAFSYLGYDVTVTDDGLVSLEAVE